MPKPRLAPVLASIATVHLLASCAQAGVPERPDGPILDQADILPPAAETALDTKLRAYWDNTGTALVVVSLNSLEGHRIEELSLQIARKWGIGDHRTKKGVLVLVAPNEREVRIEVSCALEAAIPDEAASVIIEDRMIPLFRQNAMADGTVAGVDALMERIDAYPASGTASEGCEEIMRKAA